MFGGSRRHRPPSQALNAQPANPNAATAAASAFMKRRESTNSLSSAAAAAALKALPMSPTRVGDVQTKRTLRRSASVSSHASSGSMAERTFRSRSPSPRRPGVTPAHADAPPMPSLPAQISSNSRRSQHQNASQDQSSDTRKHSSLNMTSLRVAFERIDMGEEPWVDSATGDLSNVRSLDGALPQSHPSSGPDARPGSRGSSVNFSYPARAKPASPAAPASPIPPATHEQPRRRTTRRRPVSDPAVSETLVYDPNSRRMVLKAELLAMEQTLQEGSDRPVRKKKREAARVKPNASHGSVSRPKNTGKAPAPYTHRPASTPLPLSSHADDDMYEPAVKARIASPTKSNKLRHEYPQDDIASDAQPRASGSRIVAMPQSSQLLCKKPSVVEEEPELEEEALLAEESQQSGRQDARPPPERDEVDHNCVEPRIAASGPVYSNQEINLVPQAEEYPYESRPFPVPFPSQDVDIRNVVQRHENLKNDRIQSNSPVRAPRFAPSPEKLTVKHSPPPRSVSPRKSALKQHTSPQDISPSDTSESSSAAWPILETQTRDRAPIPRKKPVRVSFDDQNTKIVGETASQSENEREHAGDPNTRRSWYNHLGKGKQKDFPSLDEDELVMKPRPALPSFGSVRGERRLREDELKVEERPLVRPYDSGYSPAYAGTPPPIGIASMGVADEPSRLALSSDAAIGTVLREQTSRDIASVSKHCEPLPPIVTSIEGYLSDGDSSVTSSESEGYVAAGLVQSRLESEVDSHCEAQKPEPVVSHAPPHSVHGDPQDDSVSIHSELETPPSKLHEIDVPAISITQPSPKSVRASPQEQPTCRPPVPPGGFPDDDSDASVEDDSTPTGPPAPSGPFLGARDEGPAAIRTRQGLDPIPDCARATSNNEDSESETSSGIYSDAYEDLSDMEGGFMSIDAVVESPISAPTFKSQPQDQLVSRSNVSTPSKDRPPSISTDTTVQASPSETTIQPSPSSLPPVPISTESEWEHAKAYWKTLSMKKRRQLEREAAEEAGAEADLDVDKPVSKAPTRKKSIDRRKRESFLRTEMDRKTKERDNERIYQIQPGSKATHQPIPSPTMRISMRKQPEPAPREPKLRKSLRSNGSALPTHTYIPTSSPGTALTSDSPQRRKVQHVLSNSAISQAPSRINGRALPSDTSTAIPTTPSTSTKSRLRRRGSSDSMSSFKRSRQSPLEPHGLRKSMRSTQVQPPRGSARFSLRSLSPTGSRFRRASADSSATITGSIPSTGHFKSTMRGITTSQVASTRKGSLHMPSFSRRSSEIKPKHGFLGRSKGSSRFHDSSDEDTRMPITFRSRFVDSSDDEIPAPVRTKPKGIGMMAKTMRDATRASRNSSFRGKQPATPTFSPVHTQQHPRPDAVREEESSPPLPDSSDDNIPAPVPVSMPTTPSKRLSKGNSLRRGGSGREILVAASGRGAEDIIASPAGSGSRKRSSIMSVLRRKKSAPGEGGIRRMETTESWARRDTRLERSKSELAAIRGSTSASGSGLKARIWPLREEDNVVEFPPAAVSPTEAKPKAKVEEGGRQEIEGGLRRKVTVDSAPSDVVTMSPASAVGSGPKVATSVATASTGMKEKKKKKFGALRRMFRLDD